jgi:hypothetical protein
MGSLEIEHILPRAAGGTSDETNLWLACRLCNGFKSMQTQAVDPRTRRAVSLFHPRRDRWEDHFRWSRDGTRVIGRSACGRATIVALQLNNPLAITVRRYWVTAGWHPPESIQKHEQDWRHT